MKFICNWGWGGIIIIVIIVMIIIVIILLIINLLDLHNSFKFTLSRVKKDYFCDIISRLLFGTVCFSSSSNSEEQVRSLSTPHIKLKAWGPNLALVNTLPGPKDDIFNVKHVLFLSLYLKI